MNMTTLKFHIPKMMKLIREGEQLPRRKASLIKRSAAKRKKGSHGRYRPRKDREHCTLNSAPTLFSDNTGNPSHPLRETDAKNVVNLHSDNPLIVRTDAALKDYKRGLLSITSKTNTENDCHALI